MYRALALDQQGAGRCQEQLVHPTIVALRVKRPPMQQQDLIQCFLAASPALRLAQQGAMHRLRRVVADLVVPILL